MRRSKHGLSHYRLATCDMGELVPVGCVEVLPGDTFQQRTSALIRVSPMNAPVMHPVQVRIHHWFVPNRIIWDDWEDFITGGDGQTAAPTFPTVTTAAGDAQGSVADYLGIPAVTGLEVSALPFRAYNLIFNEFYRDQDLVTEKVISTASGADATTDRDLEQVAWQKDYFTAARPWPQKGADVTLPIGTKAPVMGIGINDSGGFTGTNQDVKESGAVDTNYADWQNAGASSPNNFVIEEDPDNAGYPGIYADLSASGAIPINDFRRAFALQRYQEARSRYGSRYTEYLRYLGIRPADARLQRPEYLGGGKQTIAFSEVLQTAPDATTAVGDLYGHGIAALRTRRYRRFFEEHGHIISLMSVRPASMYSNALHRKWNRRTKEDYFQKELETIGQQEILTKEIFAASGAPGEVVFGYADRYREYREEPSIVTGEFRSTLDFWHLSRDFSVAPTLNQSFTDCVPSKRIHAVETNDVLWCMVNHSIQARRLVNRSAAARII